MNNKKGKKIRTLLIGILIILGLIAIGLFFFFPSSPQVLREAWRSLTRKGERIFGLERRRVSIEEKRIREEVILKKMEEANAQQDWRSLAPEYPRLKKIEGTSEEEKIQAFRNTPEFKEIEKEWEAYVRRKEDSFLPEPPTPSQGETIYWVRFRDRGEERIIERLLSAREKVSPLIPLEENLRLGIKGPLVSRKILVKPPQPSIEIKKEGEVEMTLWVLPNGTVDRVVPSIKMDSELEQIAIQYLKQWRFAPLPKDQSQVEQWGTLPIKFKLH
ncbi:MAG: energy transducer TonB [Thermodesulfobacteriota bacterium]